MSNDKITPERSIMGKVNKKHKDRVFKFIFGKNKQWALSLYNAVNGSNYTDPDAIEFNTIDEIIYIGMQNDVSFLLFSVLSIWEHQSTFNPNVPVRMFLYAAQLYDKYMTEHDCYRYSRNLIKLPSPKCMCFYNGTDGQPEEMILRLSDAFRHDGEEAVDSDIEVMVRMLNINYGNNKALMEACKPLMEYSWLIENIRQTNKKLKNIEKAVDKTLGEMPDDFVIKKFLLINKAEVKGMFLTEYDEKKILAQERQEGRLEGRSEGIHEANERVATDMLKKNLPLSLIEEISKLSEDVIRGIAGNLGLAVM